jgi:hypothetical protein
VTAFPKAKRADIGRGLPGVNRLKRFWELVDTFNPEDDEVVFVFTDIQNGDIQEHLKKLGFPVWGSGDAEQLELLRASAKEAIKKLGLAVNPYEVVTGIGSLRLYLREHEDVYVKVSEYRGIGESFHSRNYLEVEARLDKLAAELGPYRKHIQQFIVEKSIPTKIETGGDDWLVKGEFSKLVACTGTEIKDVGYLITAVNPLMLPEAVQKFNVAIEPLLKQYDYNGPFHSEIRVGEDGKDYPIDLTLRVGSPPTEIMQSWVKNLPQVIWEAAHGRRVEMEFAAKYGFQIGLRSDMALRSDIAVEIPMDLEDRVSLYHHMMDDNGLSYVLNVGEEIRELGYVVGLGDTIEAAVKDALSIAKQVSADTLEVQTDMVGKLIDELKAAKSKGIQLGSSPIPEKIEV